MVSISDNLGYVSVLRPETSDLALGGNETNFPGKQLSQLASRDAYLLARIGGSSATAQASFDNFKSVGQAAIAQGRLTLQSNTPVPGSDLLTQATLYYTPHIGDLIALWNGSAWEVQQFTQRSLALGALLTTVNYDIFLYNNGGTLTLEAVAWANSTAGSSSRASSLQRLNGVWVKASDNRRYLGTIRTSAAGQCEDSKTRRFVWNVQNRVPRPMLTQMTGVGTYSYTTAAWRACNASLTYRLQIVCGEDQSIRADAALINFSSPNVTNNGVVGIGFNKTNANDAQIFCNKPGVQDRVMVTALYVNYLSAGAHYLQMIEYGSTNEIYEGDSSVSLGANDWVGISGITALWEC